MTSCSCFYFFFKQKTAYDMRISDWSSDVCSSDLQTLRWDIKEGRVNKELEGVIVKTIAAFANSFNGGTLSIGVSDNGESVGLEHNFAFLGDADKDRFEIPLRNLLGQSFGQNFTASNLKILFPVVMDRKSTRLNSRHYFASRMHTS